MSLDDPTALQPDGTSLIDRLGTSNLAPLIVMDNGARIINPALASNHIQVIKDTHGKTSQLGSTDLEALQLYLNSLQ